MAPVTTLAEETAAGGGRTIRLLTYILDYDDLLADGARTLWLDEQPPRVRLGRADDGEALGFRAPGELRVPDRWLSSEHAVLSRHGEVDVIADLRSRNGTRVNGETVTERPLADGDLIEVGHSLFGYRVVGEAAAAALQRGAALRLGPTRTVSPEVALLLEEIGRIAPSRESVLVLGETGAGKEVLAETVHRLSGRAGPCCVVDCGAVPETLFEATFFGHRRGAFTGAAEPREGEIVRADGGTLFLDEVANLSAAAQAKLLRVIEDGKVTPLGAARPAQVDVRWVAATNADLLAGAPGFRPDLLRRLAGYVAHVPPLRRRREDLGLLAAHLVQAAGVARASITAAAARRLFLGPLPGNVRQLRTALRSAALLAGEQPIDVRHLPPDTEEPDGEDAAAGRPAAAGPAPAHAAPTVRAVPPPLAADGAGPARRAPPAAAELHAALEAVGGNVVQAAQRLGTSARQLYRWIERAGLDLSRYRD